MPDSGTRVGVGIVGLGNISTTYLRNLTTRFADDVQVVGCMDIDVERVAVAVEAFGISGYRTVTELLTDPRVELVLNLTNPLAHADVNFAAVTSGRHVYSEKPLTVDFQSADELMDQAEGSGVLVGCAPDTFLGDGLQTCRHIIDSGAIGQPIAATASMICHGHEGWHPSPAFFYQPGAGPMLDMGPYYLTALVSLMGPIRRVTGFEQMTFPTRVITSEPLAGREFSVTVPTHVAGVLEFTGGAIATMVMTFDVWEAKVPHLEIYGTKGSLSAPDPNTFAGPVEVKVPGEEGWRAVPVSGSLQDDCRGLGVVDLARAIRTGGKPRASGSMARHVLEAMHGIHESAVTGAAYVLQTTCDIPDPREELTGSSPVPGATSLPRDSSSR